MRHLCRDKTRTTSSLTTWDLCPGQMERLSQIPVCNVEIRTFLISKRFLSQSPRPCQSRLRSDLFADNHVFPIHSESHLLLNHRLDLHFCYLQIYFCFEEFWEIVHQAHELSTCHLQIDFALKSLDFRVCQALKFPSCHLQFVLLLQSFEIGCTKASSCKLVILKDLFSLWRVLRLPGSHVFILSFANIFLFLKSCEFTRLSLRADASAPMLSKVDWAGGGTRLPAILKTPRYPQTILMTPRNLKWAQILQHSFSRLDTSG